MSGFTTSDTALLQVTFFSSVSLYCIMDLGVLGCSHSRSSSSGEHSICARAYYGVGMF